MTSRLFFKKHSDKHWLLNVYCNIHKTLDTVTSQTSCILRMPRLKKPLLLSVSQAPKRSTAPY